MLAQIGSVIFLSCFKFIAGVGLASVYQFQFGTSVLTSVVGGMVGVTVFSYGGGFLASLGRKARKPGPQKTRINWKMRLIIRVRNRWGLAGIALLTPVLLTVPLGTVVGNLIERDRRKVFAYMLASFVIWSVAISTLSTVFGVNVSLLH